MKDKGILYRANEILMLSHKKEAPFIIFLLSISSLLDFISLASFLPVILLILSPLHSTEIAWMLKWNIVGAMEPSVMAVIFTILILFFIILKTQINLRIAHRKATYAYKISADLASLALTQYLSSPFSKFTNTDYTKEMNRVSNLPLMFANNIVIPAATVLSEGLLLTMFFVDVAIFDIKVLGFVTLITSPVGLAY